MMPDILIRGISIPRNCFECPLFTNCDACEGHECGCGLLGGIGYEEDISEDRRRDDCPLVELPQHGDLIDAGSLYDDLVYDVELAERALDDTTLVGKERDYIQSEKDIKQNCAYYVSHAPVVIPAERSGDGG